jgi:transposase-like protein
MRNSLAHRPKGQHSMVAAAIRTVFAQRNRNAAGEACRHVADQIRPRVKKLAALMDEAGHDVLSLEQSSATPYKSCATIESIFITRV